MEGTVIDQQVTKEQPIQEVEAKPELTAQEVLDIQKDPRWEKDWGKDPNKLYRQLKGYEKEYTPAQMLIKKHGYKSYKDLEPVLDEYKTLKDPNNDINKFINRVSGLLQTDQDVKEFQEWLAKREQTIKYRGLDENLPPQLKEDIIAGREAKEKLEKYERDMEVRDIKDQIVSSLNELEKYAAKNNLEFDRQEFLNYCKSKDVPPHLYQDIFDAKAKPFLEKQIAKKTEEGVLKTVERQKKGALSSSPKTVAQPQGKPSLDSQLDSLLGIK